MNKVDLPPSWYTLNSSFPVASLDAQSRFIYIDEWNAKARYHYRGHTFRKRYYNDLVSQLSPCATYKPKILARADNELELVWLRAK